MKDRYCHCCGTLLPAGCLFYNCRTEIVSGYDEDQPYGGDDNETMDSLLARLAKMDSQAVMDDVHQEMTLVLCPSCRTQLVKQIKVMQQGKPSPGKTKGKILPFPDKP